MIRKLIKANFLDVHFTNTNFDFMTEEELINKKDLYNHKNFSVINYFTYKNNLNTFYQDIYQQLILVRFTDFYLIDSNIFYKHYPTNINPQNYFLNYQINQFIISFCYQFQRTWFRIIVYDLLTKNIYSYIFYLEHFTDETQHDIVNKINELINTKANINVNIEINTEINLKKIDDWLTFCISHQFINKLL